MSPFRVGFAVLAASALAGQAKASPINLIVNGDFEQTTNGPGEIVPGQTGNGITQVTGWNANATSGNQGYPFLFVAAPHTADSTGFPDPWDNAAGHNQGTLAYRKIWGPNDGSNNGFTGVSPTGGNFLISDGDYHHTPIYQNLTGLQVGDRYTVGFDWAAGQWSLNSGPTTETFQVSLGNQTFSTSTFQLASHGFSGWMHETYTFLYTGGSTALTFTALGTPGGAPPMLLLDGVSMFDIPEPATAALLLVGLGGLAALGQRRAVQK